MKNAMIKKGLAVLFALCLGLSSVATANDVIKLTWLCSTSSRGFAVQFPNGQSFTVDWGDGGSTPYTVAAMNIVDIAHAYSIPGSYNVTITSNSASNRFKGIALTNNVGMTTLDLSAALMQSSVTISNNPLTSLDLGNNTTIARLTCNNNQLTSLDVSRNTALYSLTCNNNQLTKLDVGSGLSTITCYDNKLPLGNLYACGRSNASLGTQTLDTVPAGTGKWYLITPDTLLGASPTATTYGNIQYNGDTAVVDADYQLIGNRIRFLKQGVYTLEASNVSITSKAAYPAKVIYTYSVHDMITFTWPGTTSSKSFTVGATDGKTFTVDWGDNTTTQYTGGGAGIDMPVSHAYASTGVYDVAITADLATCRLLDLIITSQSVKTLDVSKAPMLEYLSCHNNRISSLDLSGNDKLLELLCYQNQLPLNSLYGCSRRVSTIDDKELGIQTPDAVPAITDQWYLITPDTLLGTPAQATQYDNITHNGNAATANVDYLRDGNRIQFLKGGIYTLDASNDSVVSSPSYPVKVTYTYLVQPVVHAIVTGGHGTISPLGDSVVASGSEIVYTFTPNPGYELESVKVDGVDRKDDVSNHRYTLANITATHTVEATFKPAQYTVTARVPGGNGTISPGDSVASYGDTLVYTITPATHYVLESFQVDGADSTASVVNGQYTLTITAAHALVAHFIPLQDTITSSVSGIHGHISPEGDSVANHGSSITYTLTPDTGYELEHLLVNGTDVKDEVVNNEYTLAHITSPHTVVASFKVAQYTVYARAAGRGTISPGDSVVSYGDTIVYTITPDNQYVLDMLLVDGADLIADTANNEYTLAHITASHTIVAQFSAAQDTLTASVSGGHGSISPVGDSIANHGSSVVYTLTPEAGYALDSLLVDGINLAADVANNEYTFSYIRASHTIRATFIVEGEKPVIVDLEANGSALVGGEDNRYVYTPSCTETSLALSISATGAITVDGQPYTSGMTIDATADTTLSIVVTNSQSTTSYTLQVAANVPAANMYIRRFDNTVAIISNPANNGGYHLTDAVWYNAAGAEVAQGGVLYLAQGADDATAYHAAVKYNDAFHQVCGSMPAVVAASLSVWPNPAVSSVTITVGEQHVGKEAVVYSLHGNAVQRFTLTEATSTLNVSSYTPGIYYLKVADETATILVGRN